MVSFHLHCSRVETGNDITRYFGNLNFWHPVYIKYANIKFAVNSEVSKLETSICGHHMFHITDIGCLGTRLCYEFTIDAIQVICSLCTYLGFICEHHCTSLAEISNSCWWPVHCGKTCSMCPCRVSAAQSPMQVWQNSSRDASGIISDAVTPCHP